MTQERNEVAAAWFLENFEVNGFVDIEKGTINVHGSCRVREDRCLGGKLDHKFGFVTGNFSLRSEKMKDLSNMPSEVGGTAILSWHEHLPLLHLVCLRGHFILIDESTNDHSQSGGARQQAVTSIIENYQQSCMRRKAAVTKAIQELIETGLYEHAKF